MALQIAYFLIFGKPVIFWLGLATYASFLITGYIGLNIYRGWHNWPIKYHLRMVITSFILATIHGLLGVLMYFHF